MSAVVPEALAKGSNSPSTLFSEVCDESLHPFRGPSPGGLSGCSRSVADGLAHRRIPALARFDPQGRGRRAGKEARAQARAQARGRRDRRHQSWRRPREGRDQGRGQGWQWIGYRGSRLGDHRD